MPVIRLKTVVLPAPFGPITLTISPSSTCRSRPSTTRRPPNDFVTPRSSSRRRRSLIGQPLPYERGRGRVRGDREVPPDKLEGGSCGKRSFPPRERAGGEGRSYD